MDKQVVASAIKFANEGDLDLFLDVLRTPTGDVLKREILKKLFPELVSYGPHSAFGVSSVQAEPKPREGGTGLEGSLGMNTISGGKYPGIYAQILKNEFGMECVRLTDIVKHTGVKQATLAMRIYKNAVKTYLVPGSTRFKMMEVKDFRRIFG